MLFRRGKNPSLRAHVAAKAAPGILLQGWKTPSPSPQSACGMAHEQREGVKSFLWDNLGNAMLQRLY